MVKLTSTTCQKMGFFFIEPHTFVTTSCKKLGFKQFTVVKGSSIKLPLSWKSQYSSLPYLSF